MKRFLCLLFLLLSISVFAQPLDPGEIFNKPWEEVTREERQEFRRRRTIANYEPSGKPSRDRIDYYIRIYKSMNVFDPKITVFEVKAEDNGTTVILTGDVLYSQYKSGLERTLNSLGFDQIENNINVLPDSDLGKMGFAVVTASSTGIRRNPSERSEHMNEVVKGDGLRLLKSDETGEWFLAQGPDAYIGWVAAADLKRMELKEWAKHQKISESDHALKEEIEKIVEPILGIPYVWGGVTDKGLDCSGLTQYVYKRLGINLPRDADEQSNVGELVAFPDYMENLRAGDLLFFSGSGRISHVAISLGGLDFYESVNRSGVRFSSFDPDSPAYNNRSDERFVFAKRILREKTRGKLVISDQ
ncbi:C40 family peptidase [Candidatus Sumerlaeota bacterium]|nr:C40 family peptidase [Candidatus Sumerlaeota bacterium]